MNTRQFCVDTVSVTFPNLNSAMHSRTNHSFVVSKALQFAQKGRVGFLLHVIA